MIKTVSALQELSLQLEGSFAFNSDVSRASLSLSLCLSLVGDGPKITPQLSRLNFHIIFNPLLCSTSIYAHFPHPEVLSFVSSLLLVTITLVQSLMLFFLVGNVYRAIGQPLCRGLDISG